MSKRIVCAVSGKRHIAVQAPQWDYDAGQKITLSGEVAQSDVFASPLILLYATAPCFIRIGAEPVAADAAGSRPLSADKEWAETVEIGQKLSVLGAGSEGALFIIPAKTEL